MATTLDQSMMNLLVHVQQKNLESVLDIDQWTKDTREDQAARVEEIVNSSTTLALELIKDMINADHEGKPLLYWYLYNFALTASLNIYQDYRSHFEMGDNRNDSPFDSQWLADKITTIIDELKAVDDILLKHDLLNQDEEL